MRIQVLTDDHGGAAVKCGDDVVRYFKGFDPDINAALAEAYMSGMRNGALVVANAAMAVAT